ncbi:MAG TPA: hypothetical protein VJB62_01185 [Patescibacteria group bacterium]|nr:hypothetical protein [Patescibacteria group bacterium]
MKTNFMRICLILVIGGCQISVSSPRAGLWVNREERDNSCDNWNFKIGLYAGKFVRPIKGDDGNPWQGAKPKDVWYSDFIILPFVSAGVEDFGFYLGGKHFDYTQDHEDRYGSWFPYPQEYGEYLTISGRMTTNRCDK